VHLFWPWQPCRFAWFVSSQQAAIFWHSNIGELFGAIVASIFPFEAASKALQLAILCIKRFLCPICKLQIPIHNHDMIPWNHADMRGTNFDLRLGEGTHLKCEGVRPRMFVLICSYKSKSAVFLLHRYHVCLQTYMSKIPETDNESKINTHTHTTTTYPNHPY